MLLGILVTSVGKWFCQCCNNDADLHVLLGMCCIGNCKTYLYAIFANRGGGISAGKFRHPPPIWVTVAGITVPGIHSGYMKVFWDTHWVHKLIIWDTQEKLFEVRTSMNTDPDMQYTGTSTSPTEEPC